MPNKALHTNMNSASGFHIGKFKRQPNREYFMTAIPLAYDDTGGPAVVDFLNRITR
jgi:hypothetical protein